MVSGAVPNILSTIEAIAIATATAVRMTSMFLIKMLPPYNIFDFTRLDKSTILLIEKYEKKSIKPDFFSGIVWRLIRQTARILFVYHSDRNFRNAPRLYGHIELLLNVIEAANVEFVFSASYIIEIHRAVVLGDAGDLELALRLGVGDHLGA